MVLKRDKFAIPCGSVVVDAQIQQLVCEVHRLWQSEHLHGICVEAALNRRLNGFKIELLLLAAWFSFRISSQLYGGVG